MRNQKESDGGAQGKGLAKRLLAHLARWLPRLGKIHLDLEYQKAHDFKNLFHPKNGVDYEWVTGYARQIYDQFDQADQVLDAKAESIIKVLGGGSGLLTLGAILNLPKLPTGVLWCLAVALVLALLGIFFAAWVRMPRQAFLPPSIAWALAYSDHYGKDAENKFLAQWHLACEGMRLAVRNKARGVTLATWFASAALAAVSLAFFVAILKIDEVNASNPAGGVQQMVQNPGSENSTPPAPDPSGVTQTPEPALQAEPQVINRGAPATTAEPQSIRFGRNVRDGAGESKG
jgi:hypothetical protein